MSKGKIDQVIIPGGATGHIQAPDVSWNKPMKDKLRELYDQWMEEGPHATTKGGNMRGPPLKSIIQWIINAWSNLDREIIVKSFRCCALALAPDGSEDNEIACFKPGKTFASGLERLKSFIRRDFMMSRSWGFFRNWLQHMEKLGKYYFDPGPHLPP